MYLFTFYYINNKTTVFVDGYIESYTYVKNYIYIYVLTFFFLFSIFIIKIKNKIIKKYISFIINILLFITIIYSANVRM